MAADLEQRLVSSLVREDAVREAVDRGVKPSWFHVADHRAVYTFLLSHYDKYGRTASAATVKDEFPSYDLLKVSDPPGYFMDQLVAFNREGVAMRLASEAVASLKAGDHEGVLTKAQDLLEDASSFSPIPVFITDLSSSVQDRWEEYEEREKRGTRIIGWESGYPTIDNATLGFQSQQLIVLVAEAKRGKTTLCMNMGINLHEKYDLRPLFISFEMSRAELQNRHDAIRSKVPLSALLSGTLTSDERDRYADMLDDLETKSSFWLADATQGVTVSSVAAQIAKHDPDIIIVDGVYMMTDEVSGEVNSPLALTNITRGLKRLAQSVRRPIIISTQALTWKTKKGRISGDSAGYSSSFAQDADVMLGLEKGVTDDTRNLVIVLSRNSGPANVVISFDYESGEFGEL